MPTVSAPSSSTTAGADRILRPLRKSVEVAIVVLFAVLTVAVFIQVVARYVFNQPPTWTEELARFCQVWIVLLASSVCVRKGTHLAVDYLGPALAPRARRAVALFTGALVALYAAVVAIWGVRLLGEDPRHAVEHGVGVSRVSGFRCVDAAGIGTGDAPPGA